MIKMWIMMLILWKAMPKWMVNTKGSNGAESNAKSDEGFDEY
jgi:hypothetical protein